MSESFYPLILSPEELDEYLSRGWYRMGQRLFTVDYIYLGEWIRVFWLRFRLREYAFGKKQRQLLARFNRFSIRIVPMKLTDEHEELYSIYRRNIDFDTSDTASQFLLDFSPQVSFARNVFDSHLIEVRDEGRLIAVGVFDKGKKALAGILNFYDPGYARYSPGKCLMLKKIELAMELGLDWYYPGYIGYPLPKFDYKLYPGTDTAEVFDPFLSEWIPYRDGLVAELTQAQQVLFGPFKDPDEESEDGMLA